MRTTDGHLLAGRLRYRQLEDGYRTGLEPVLLAAAVPAEPGQRVLEAGTGAGAGLLCLLARVPGLAAIGVELDPAMAALARHNLASNALSGEIVQGDVTSLPGWRVDHAFANPPWHGASNTPSPVVRRRLAKQEAGSGLGGWIGALARCLAPGGTLTLIVPAPRAAAASAAMAAAGLGGAVLQPLAPRSGRAAKLALVQARQGDARAARLAPPIVLHAETGFTDPIEAVLRQGAALPLGALTAA